MFQEEGFILNEAVAKYAHMTEDLNQEPPPPEPQNNPFIKPYIAKHGVVNTLTAIVRLKINKYLV